MNLNQKLSGCFLVLLLLFTGVQTAVAQDGAQTSTPLTFGRDDPFINQFSQMTVFMISPDSDKAVLGTGFVLYYTFPQHPDRFTWLLVTAKHVIANRPDLVVRFNTGAGDPLVIHGPLSELRSLGDVWEHPDPGVDLVVIRLNVVPQVSITGVQMDLIGTPENLATAEVKPLDRVILPNLVQPQYSKKNISIVRDGSIASLTREKFTTPTGENQQYIFINSLVHGGMSGGPVFLDPRHNPSSPNRAPLLLGVISGHEGTEAENTGVTLIVPAWKILEILQTPVAQRRIAKLDREFDGPTKQ